MIFKLFLSHRNCCKFFEFIKFLIKNLNFNICRCSKCLPSKYNFISFCYGMRNASKSHISSCSSMFLISFWRFWWSITGSAKSLTSITFCIFFISKIETKFLWMRSFLHIIICRNYYTIIICCLLKICRAQLKTNFWSRLIICWKKMLCLIKICKCQLSRCCLIRRDRLFRDKDWVFLNFYITCILKQRWSNKEILCLRISRSILKSLNSYILSFGVSKSKIFPSQCII